MTSSSVPLDATTVSRAAAAVEHELAAVNPSDWDRPVPDLEWTCRDVLEHLVGVLDHYTNLAGPGRRARPIANDMTATVLLQQLARNADALATRLRQLPDDARVDHVAGRADPEGLAAMACDEMLVHADDVARALGLVWEPDGVLCATVLQRLFPWAPRDGDPWRELRRQNGRRDAAGPPPVADWVWHCAPLAEWDGTVPRWDASAGRVIRTTAKPGQPG